MVNCFIIVVVVAVSVLLFLYELKIVMLPKKHIEKGLGPNKLNVNDDENFSLEIIVK